MKTPQVEFWTGNFGKEYTERNYQTIADSDLAYKNNYGVKRSEMNGEFLGSLNKESKILEVGCNIALQLLQLQSMGFSNLYGIELQHYAVERAKENVKNISIIQGSGFDLPFKDNYFDMVYTSGVLIHIAPADVNKFMSEIVRVSNKMVWGFEYYSPELKQLNYRGNEGFMWKANYPELYTKNFPELSIVKQKIYPYINDSEKGNEDIMYLLEKKNA
jgi:pseudaminic acid biosynthesis-associated methylase